MGLRRGDERLAQSKPSVMAVRDSRISMKQMSVMPCGLHPHYSEGGIYEWACDKCASRRFGNEDQKPPCQRAPKLVRE